MGMNIEGSKVIISMSIFTKEGCILKYISIFSILKYVGNSLLFLFKIFLQYFTIGFIM